MEGRLFLPRGAKTIIRNIIARRPVDSRTLPDRRLRAMCESSANRTSDPVASFRRGGYPEWRVAIQFRLMEMSFLVMPQEEQQQSLAEIGQVESTTVKSIAEYVDSCEVTA